MMIFLVWLLLGALSATLLIATINSKTPRQQQRILETALIITAIIYILFSLAHHFSWILIEILGLVINTGFVALSIIRSAIWLAIGWGLHPLWDVILHLYGYGHQFTPEWYAVACISFDLVIVMFIYKKIINPKPKQTLSYE